MIKSKQEVITLRQEIYQANPIVQACKRMNVLEMRIFFLGLRGLNPHLSRRDKVFDDDFKEIFIPNKQLRSIFDNVWYLNKLSESCKNLFRNDCIELRREDGGFRLVHLFRRLEYVNEEGLYIWFDDLMKPYILDLFKTSYTRISVEQIFYLSSTYSIRLLELMLQYQNIPGMKNKIKRTLTVEEVRFALNVPSNAYKGRMNNFKKNVIDLPIAEINSNTKYKMSCTSILVGKKTVKFEFELDVSGINLQVFEKNVPLLVDRRRNEKKEVRPPVTIDMEVDKNSKDIIDKMAHAVVKPLPPVTAIRLFDFEEIKGQAYTKSHAEQIKKDAAEAGLTLEVFQKDETPVYPGLIQYFKDHFEEEPVIKALFSTYGLTPERFKELYCKNFDTPEKSN